MLIHVCVHQSHHDQRHHELYQDHISIMIIGNYRKVSVWRFLDNNVVERDSYGQPHLSRIILMIIGIIICEDDDGKTQ